MLLFAASIHAQWTYPNCANATDADFTVSTVISRAVNDPSIMEPLKMDFALNADGTTDIYYIQRSGELKRFNAMSKTVALLGTVAVVTHGEDGLVGLALDPNFRSNNRVFFYYSHATGFRVSRFTLNPATKLLDLGSEKVLLTIPSQRGTYHTSGAMKFDAYGDLWINVGDNATAYKGPANTHDLRGGILRIHPEENGTYTIPKGNMWEFAAAYFRSHGRIDVADKYLDSSFMKREIYVKGTRNAYTLTLDPVRRWAVYGDCGPDQESGTTSDRSLWTEEHDVVTEPSFMGWPFWTGNDKPQTVYPYYDAQEKAAFPSPGMNPDAPVNAFPGIGIPELLPAKPGTYVYAHACAMTGPIFRYDGRLANPGQIPPHFNRIWFSTDFDRDRIMAIKLDNQGKMVGNAVEMFKGLSSNLSRPLDFEQGPDGALYYLSYSCGPWHTADACTGIYRIGYIGSCKDTSLVPEKPVTAKVPKSQSLLQEVRLDPEFRTLRVSAVGSFLLEVQTVDGRTVFSSRGQGEASYAASLVFSGRGHLVYRVRLVTVQGESRLSIPWFN